MSTRVKIITPPPSVEETANLAGVSRKRTRELIDMARAHGNVLVYRSTQNGRFTTKRKAAAKLGQTKATPER
jgi:aryl-alcohol dehydrogenase-like predicted oxidoreductase